MKNYLKTSARLTMLCVLFSFVLVKGVEIDLVEYYGEGQDKTMGELVAQAKTENKRPILYFNATWCAACKAFDENMTKKSVGKTLSDYRVILVDVDADKTGQALTDKYNINSIPTIIEIDEKGELIRTVGGEKLGSTKEIEFVFKYFDMYK